jgi:hypothetical protein
LAEDHPVRQFTSALTVCFIPVLLYPVTFQVPVLAPVLLVFPLKMYTGTSSPLYELRYPPLTITPEAHFAVVELAVAPTAIVVVDVALAVTTLGFVGLPFQYKQLAYAVISRKSLAMLKALTCQLVAGLPCARFS